MTLPEITASRPAPQRAHDRSSWVRLVLLFGWVFVALMTAVIGERETDFDHLTEAIADGRVARISISGEGFGPTASGQLTQEVHWREGSIRRVSTVSVRSPGEDAFTTDGEEDAFTTDGEERDTITADDVGTYLTERHPNLTVTRVGSMDSYSSSRLGWRIPQWLGLLGLSTSLATLAPADPRTAALAGHPVGLVLDLDHAHRNPPLPAPVRPDPSAARPPQSQPQADRWLGLPPGLRPGQPPDRPPVTAAADDLSRSGLC